MRTPVRRKRDRASERGAALILVIFAATLILLLLLTIHAMTATAGRGIVRQLQSQGQATNAAGSGLHEALSWFVHQNQQPVTSFDPKADTGGVCTHIPKHSPLVYESEDPAIGIVRSYEIAGPGRVWGRYEVRRTAVTDVSKKRGRLVDGAQWKLESNGIVYVRNDPSKGPGEDTTVRYVPLYSRDNGQTFLYMKDDQPAQLGVRPDAGYLQMATSYPWPVPKVKFPKGNYLLRIEAYRDEIPLHYSFHQYRAFIKR